MSPMISEMSNIGGWGDSGDNVKKKAKVNEKMCGRKREGER